MRIAIGGFHHETNSFSPILTSYEAFCTAGGWPALSVGEEIIDRLNNTYNIPISGFMQAARTHELVPLIWCDACPGGPVTSDAFERISLILLERLEQSMPVDALYLDLHGAMITEDHLDGEAELLTRIREIIGDDIPVIVNLDLHGNISEAMVNLADICIAYRTYPHVDFADIGKEALRQLEAYKGSILKSFTKFPFLIPLTSQCTLIEPTHTIYQTIKEKEHIKGISSISFLTGFPPGDTPDTGPTLLVYGTDQKTVDNVTQELTAFINQCQPQFQSKLWQPDEAISYAIQNYRNKPFILADTQDNPGAGATSDTMGIIQSMISQHAKGVVGCIHDPNAATRAHEAGVGNNLTLALGGKTSEPLKAEFKIIALGDGNFTATGPMYQGTPMQLGKMALLQTDNVKIIVSSIKQHTADQSIFRHVGIEPSKEPIVVVKSSVHFRADFEPIAEEVLIVEAPGMNIEDPRKLPYRHYTIQP